MIYLFVIIVAGLFIDYILWTMMIGGGASFYHMWKERLAPLLYDYNVNRYQSKFDMNKKDKYPLREWPNNVSSQIIGEPVKNSVSSIKAPIKPIKYMFMLGNNDRYYLREDSKYSYAGIRLFLREKVVDIIYYLNQGYVETEHVVISNVKYPEHHFYSPNLLQRNKEHALIILSYIEQYQQASLFDGDIETLVDIFIATYRKKTGEEYNMIEMKEQLIQSIEKEIQFN